MTVISFMSANYVARVLGYRMPEGWMQGDAATNAFFQPEDTFETRFAALVSDVAGLGFQAMDLWTAHLNPAWATPNHVAMARDVLERHAMKVVSLAGYFGDTVEEVTAACGLAQLLGARVLGGDTALLSTDRQALVTLLHGHGLRLGIENHPERTPEELLAKIGEGDDVIGACVDTGWFGTHGYNAASAMERLGQTIVHVHLKDVLPPAPDAVPGVSLKSIGHETCGFGHGVVPLEECVRVLQAIGYTGGLSIEHEPEEFDPSDDVRESLALLRQWVHG